jgi:hypothetical protein
MKIYISSSWKNREQVKFLAKVLRLDGHYVFDFTDQSRRKEKICPPEKFPEDFDCKKHLYSTYISSVPEWISVVEENKKEVENCDMIILLLPCGVDATADWAYGVGKGKKSIIVGKPKNGDRSPTHNWADKIFDNIVDALSYLRKGD